ncbi:MAG: hypothetical protein AAGC74_12915 [Verrucomicrobiota bacterium]
MDIQKISWILVSIILPAHSATTFFSGEIGSSDWTTAQVIGNGGQVFSISMTDGNPDTFFRVETIDTSFINYTHLNSSFIHNPATVPINTIDFSIDVRNFFAFQQGMGFAVIAEQDNNIYQAPYLASSSTPDTFDWHTRSQPNALFQSDFAAIVGNGTLDFSSSGSPITFGLLTFNSGGLGITAGFDNYQVTVNPVPEPTAPCFLIASTFFASAYRKRTMPKLA